MLKDAIERALKETGRLAETGRITVEGIEGDTRSDNVKVIINGYKKRCRKPFCSWELTINIARGLIFWDRSEYCNL